MKAPAPGRGWTVLVTGASSGLGRCLALELGRLGCSVMLSGRSAQRLGAAAQEVLEAGAEAVEVFEADLDSRGGPGGLVEAVTRSGWTVDALVNNAGAGRAGLWSDQTSALDEGLVRLLVEAPMALTRAFLPGWRARGRGALLNVASTGAFQPGPQTAVYYAAKAFLLSWSLAVAREERSWLTVTTLCPGALKTGFSQAAGKNDVPGAPGPERTARKAIQAWQRGQSLLVPGLFNKIAVFASRLLPLTWTAAGVEAFQLSVKNR